MQGNLLNSSERAADELRRVVSALVRRLRAESTAQPFTWSQLTLLKRLDGGAALTTADLARLEQVTPQAMGERVAELESAGLVARTPDATDKRRRRVSLTRAGGKALAQSRAMRQAWLAERIRTRLSRREQRAVLEAVALLDRLVGP